MADDKNTSMPARFAQFVKERGLRSTPERKAIVAKINASSERFDADKLHRWLEADGYHVSLSTVYNTLELMLQSGLLRKYRFNDVTALYEKVQPRSKGSHFHIICTECGKVKEVKDPDLIRFMNSKRFPAFKVEYFTLHVYATCNACLRRLKREERERAKALAARKAAKERTDEPITPKR